LALGDTVITVLENIFIHDENAKGRKDERNYNSLRFAFSFFRLVAVKKDSGPLSDSPSPGRTIHRLMMDNEAVKEEKEGKS